MKTYNNKMLQLLLLAGVASMVGFVPNVNAAEDGKFHVYLDPRGSDRNNGLTPEKPLFSLQRASYILKKNLAAAPKDAVVHVAPGLYQGQKNRWSFSMPKNEILIVGDGGRPVFDGAGAGAESQWLNIVRGAAKAGDTQNIHVRGMNVQNYHSALRIGGAGTGYPRSKGGITVSSMNFSAIGAVFAPGSKESHFAIYIVDSDQNWIVSNRFRNINNNASYPTDYSLDAGGLHAIYVTRSHGTIVQKNKFMGVYARGVVKFRDFSNFSKVYQNEFYDDTTLVQDHYCPQSNSSCDSFGEKWNECPSYGLVWQDNIYKYSRTGDVRPTLSLPFYPENEAYCKGENFFRDRGLNPSDPMNQVKGVPRIRSRGNIHDSKLELGAH